LHQAREAAVERHADIGLAEHDPAGGSRGERGSRGGHVGRDGDFGDGEAIDAHRAAGIKAEPAEPQDQAADGGGRHVVAGNGVDLAILAILSDAWPKHDDAGQGRPAADRVHLRAAGEIDEATVCQPAATPDPVADDGINADRHDQAEDDERQVLDALGHGSGDDVAAVPANTAGRKLVY
jgi:hypothetical protein